jgi:hypothetical protein
MKNAATEIIRGFLQEPHSVTSQKIIFFRNIPVSITFTIACLTRTLQILAFEGSFNICYETYLEAICS